MRLRVPLTSCDNEGACGSSTIGGTVRTIRLLVVLAVGAAGLAPALPAAAAVTSVTGVAPSRVDAPTTPWTTLDLTGSGLAAGDIVKSVPSSSSVLFSSSVDDGAGGIKVNVRVNGATYGTYDVVVADPGDSSSATCSGCLQLGASPRISSLTTMTP